LLGNRVEALSSTLAASRVYDGRVIMTRREWFAVASATPLLAQSPSAETPPRIARVIHEYEQQGIHRTATEVDRRSGEWLAGQVRQAGLKPELENFTISRIDLVAASVLSNGRRVEGIPLFDCTFTDAAGVRGRIGPLGSDAGIGLTEIAPNEAGRGALVEARRQNKHRAILVITRGGRPGLCPSNAEDFLHPFGPPVLQISSEESAWINDLSKQGAQATVIAQVNRTPGAESFNVTASIPGADHSLPPLIIMTPRSGWWTCASERGGGIACWLELMRAMRGMKPAREVRFVASSGHELGQLGIEIYAQRREGLIKQSRGWIHFGANVGAAQDPGNTIQASDDQMERTMAEQLTAAGLKIDRRVPRGTVPGGEAGVVHRGGGRYMSIIGRSALFHNPLDRGPDAADPAMIARFAAAFTTIAKGLAET